MQAHGYPDASFVASEDMSSAQYFAVIFGTTRGECTLAGANEKAFGIVQNAPESGEDAIVRCGGFSLARIGEASLSTGDFLTPTAAGDLEQVDAADEWCCAILVDDDGTVADGDEREVFITHFTASAGDA